MFSNLTTLLVRPGERGMTVATSDGERLTYLAKVLAERVGTCADQLWFASTRFRIQNSEIVIGVPNRHFEEWLKTTFGTVVTEAVAKVFGKALPVHYVIEADLLEEAPVEANAPPASKPQHAASPQPASKRKRSSRAEPAAPEPTPEAPAPTRRAAPRSRRWHKLSDFLVGACNRVAFAAATSVVEEPGENVNPLVLHGPVGTGKTHLLEGVYAGLRRIRPDWRVLYVTTEEFTNRFVNAMRMNKLGAFRRHFRECDALLMDDLHFLATKRATAEEFLHTFDVLLADNRQMVLTTDCHPRLADDFTPELTDRLLGGAVWGLLPPDADTRLAILRAKAHKEGGPPVPDDVLRYLANQLRGNVRELEVRAAQRAPLQPRHQSRHRHQPGARSPRRPAPPCRPSRAGCGRGSNGLRRLAAGPGCAAIEGPRLDDQPSAHAGDVPGPQAHGFSVQRDRRPLRRPQSQHRGGGGEKGSPMAGARCRAGVGRAAHSRRELLERIERELLR